MLRCGSVSSVLPDAYRAGCEVGEALADLRPELVLLFSSVDYGEDFDQLFEGLYDGLGTRDVRIFGGTGDGICERSGVFEQGVAALALSTEGAVRWTIDLVQGVGADSFASANDCARRSLAAAGRSAGDGRARSTPSSKTLPVGCRRSDHAALPASVVGTARPRTRVLGAAVDRRARRHLGGPIGGAGRPPGRLGDWLACGSHLTRRRRRPSTATPAHPSKTPNERAVVANIKSQIKRNKTNEKAHERNKAVKSELKTEVRRTREAIAAGDKAAAEKALAKASKKLDKAVSKGVIHENQAANRKSAIAKQVAAL